MSGVVLGADGSGRCFWCVGDPLNERYHDQEWGRPTSEDRRLFEKICLEGFQSGLSWLTILRKRENFRAAFAGFDIEKIAKFTPRKIDELLGDAGIVRNRAKIEATVNNARRYADLVDEFGSLAAFVWRFEPDPASRPANLDWDTLSKTSTSPEATALSKELRRRHWAFVGPTTAYAFMEAVGLVNDHLTGCAVRDEVERDRRAFARPA